jgi:hypothetical protein
MMKEYLFFVARVMKLMSDGMALKSARQAQ